MKRGAGDVLGDDNELKLTPLGAGREVGRSCLLLEYKGLKVLLDCGVMPSLKGMDSLPSLDTVPPSSVDVVVITCVFTITSICSPPPAFLLCTPFVLLSHSPPTPPLLCPNSRLSLFSLEMQPFSP